MQLDVGSEPYLSQQYNCSHTIFETGRRLLETLGLFLILQVQVNNSKRGGAASLP